MQAAPQRILSLFDAVCIAAGIIIGAGIYQITPAVARGAGTVAQLMSLWIIGGLLSLCGALSYAELAAAYPNSTGGDFVYLTKAYGRPAGFLFGWSQLVIVRPGDIAVMAFAFATYGRQIWEPAAVDPQISQRLYAAGAVVVLTLMNMLGVRQGKWTQNLLTAVKAVGLIGIAAAGLAVNRPVEPARPLEPIPAGLALIFVLFTYGGWNEVAYVAAEVKNPGKNIVRALAVGMAAVMILYLLVNGAFVYGLTFGGLAASEAPASDMLACLLPSGGRQLISALICVSALGAVNGLIFTGARISYAMGSEYRLFRLLGNWNQHTGGPVWALAVQGSIAVCLIVVFGGYMDAILYTAAAVYAFYMATAFSVIVLRYRQPQVPRPYQVSFYPLPPLIFCIVCAFLIYNSVSYAWAFRPASLLVLATAAGLGLAVYIAVERYNYNC
ncbi:MAG TPA: amino acid permease [Anaerohalosphaeraceae bacterium]|nr:amino acid permease [Phycisphaerae bacterium]HOK95158.1 amino acid permease [Anaerohalosphaeraceae bacterium]HOL31055.1 amino acid permease [Anaerohalosphaeraceae bacterium]HOM75877.1 amino acid permease [Anaerohalosphaeraceae bacterium]HPC64148.1 amino acid permease [Anaerohalosphaeraceae bacterium]